MGSLRFIFKKNIFISFPKPFIHPYVASTKYESMKWGGYEDK